ncbi:MAG: hypothetical protein ACTSRK_08880 [Promethearchaeota archaeon]
MKKNELERSIECYLKALENNAEDGGAWSNLGNSYASKKIMINWFILRVIRRALKARQEYDLLISTRGWYPLDRPFPSYLAVLNLNYHPKPGEGSISREFLKGDKIWRTPSHKKGYRQIFFFPAFPGTDLEGRLNSRQKIWKTYFLVVPNRRSHLVKLSYIRAMWWVRKMATIRGVI